MITTNYNPHAQRAGKFLVTATDPAGEWSEPVFIDQPGIDPSLFFDDDGKVYVTSNEAFSDLPVGIYQAELDVATGELLTENRLIWEGTGGIYPEGPHLYKKDDWYYLLISEGGTQMGHYISVSRSKSPWGPFEKCPHNPILTHADRRGMGHEIQGLGHGDWVEAEDGSWWLVYLGFRQPRPFFHHLGRETFLSPMRWDDAGWPVVLNPGRPDGSTDLEIDHATLPAHPWSEPAGRDLFHQVQTSWCAPGAPAEGEVEVLAPGLKICGSEKDWDSGGPVMRCRRQQHFDCRVATRLDSTAGEAGLTVYYQPEHHYEIFVTPEQVGLRKTIGDLSVVVALRDRQGAGWVELEVVADRDEYRFLIKEAEGQRELGTARTQFVSTEATVCSFTGVMLGMYACRGDAYFAWFEYEEIKQDEER